MQQPYWIYLARISHLYSISDGRLTLKVKVMERDWDVTLTLAWSKPMSAPRGKLKVAAIGRCGCPVCQGRLQGSGRRVIFSC